jgi:polyisoprenoid-binding protein YceI
MTKPAQFTARTSRARGTLPRALSSSPRDRSGSPHRHHWGRWILGGVAVLLVLIVAGAAVAVKLQPSPAPLALPSGTPAAPSGPLAGRWQVAAGSAAGFRVQETIIGMSNEVGGNTNAVTGTAVLGSDRIASGSFGINLTMITVGGKKQPQFATSLDTQRYPAATVTLARPVPLSAAFAAGRTATMTAPAELTLNGTTRPVTVTITARRAGTALQATGRIPVTFANWGIKQPTGYGPIGSLAGHGTADFVLVLHRAG